MAPPFSPSSWPDGTVPASAQTVGAKTETGALNGSWGRPNGQDFSKHGYLEHRVARHALVTSTRDCDSCQRHVVGSHLKLHGV